MGIIVSGLEREEGRSKKGHLVPIIPILTIFGFHMLAIQFKKKKKNFKKEKQFFFKQRGTCSSLLPAHTPLSIRQTRFLGAITFLKKSTSINIINQSLHLLWGKPPERDIICLSKCTTHPKGFIICREQSLLVSCKAYFSELLSCDTLKLLIYFLKTRPKMAEILLTFN